MCYFLKTGPLIGMHAFVYHTDLSVMGCYNNLHVSQNTQYLLVLQYLSLYNSLTLIVSPPLIIRQPANSKVTIFGQVIFQCTVQAVGETAVIWKKDQSPLPVTATVNNIRSLNEVTSVLKITGVNGFYRGLYYCIAKNKAGQTTSRYAKLSVKGIIKS